jgi:hypothetical protein
MPCIDDPCSSSPVILEATSNLQAAYRYIQSARDVGEVEAGAVLVKNALAAFEKATAKCQAANHAATAAVKSPGTGTINIDWGNAFGQLFQVQNWAPLLTFEPPFFTFVKLASPMSSVPFNFAPNDGLIYGGEVTSVTGIGAFSRCTGLMTLGVSITTVTNGAVGVNGAIVPIEPSQKTDTFLASVMTSSTVVSSATLAGLENMAGPTSFSNSPFSKQTQSGTHFFGGLTGIVSVQGGVLASFIEANPHLPVLLNLTMKMDPKFPLV